MTLGGGQAPLFEQVELSLGDTVVHGQVPSSTHEIGEIGGTLLLHVDKVDFVGIREIEIVKRFHAG